MEAVILIGIQATGKSSFYHARFVDTHMRLNLDMLKTRHREGIFLRACIEAKQPFVVDNTNPSMSERAKYIDAARQASFRVVGYYFQSRLEDAIRRNAERSLADQVPVRGIQGAAGRLELPHLDEGFDALSYVRIGPDGTFIVEDWDDDL